jgi:DNA-binding CsgD family transcriptional regulator
MCATTSAPPTRTSGVDPDLLPGRRGPVQRGHGRGVRLRAQARAPTWSTPSTGWPPGRACSTRWPPRRCWSGSGSNGEPEELAALTPQERRILELIAQGLTNRQIGEHLFLAEKTVKNYVSSLLAKLGLKRRTQAAILANRLLRN